MSRDAIEAIHTLLERTADLVLAEREFERAKTDARDAGADESMIQGAIDLIHKAAERP